MAQPFRKNPEKHFLAATNEVVMRVDAASGEIAWQQRIPGATGYVVTLLTDMDRVYAGTAGRVACLDANNGAVIWCTEVNKLTEPVGLALDPRPPGVHLIASSDGVLFGLDAEGGALLWHNGLSGMGYHPICLRVEGGIVAQPRTRKISSGKSTVTQVLESEQDDG